LGDRYQMSLRHRLCQISTAAVVVSGLALSGCAGYDGVELNGKLFDMMGVSTSSQDNRQRDPKMADRPPLVVPPSVTRLPEPGSGKAISTDVAALNDPELRKAIESKDRERLHLAYCRGELQWREKALDPNTSAKSPYGPCPNLVNTITGKTNKQ
jgi:hypothetical protein